MAEGQSDVPPQPPGHSSPPPPPGYVPPQAPGYASSPPPTPGYSPPPAPGHASPQAPGYAPPAAHGYAPPAAQGYPVGGYAAGAYPAAVPPRGLLPWALGLLILIPFPFVGGIASGIAMAVSGGASRRFGGPARENARTALNWGLTYLLVSTVLLVSHFVILFTLTADSPASGFYPIGIPITLYFAVSIFHLALVIMGMVRASGGKIMRVPFAIPYLRA
ncbi:DUF4870 domain-containing protein [Microbacterium foliorum]|uniref:DUF4870 domain-containing protein n=1 Tax=Microbacterium foliorum TaxID=104336 RepID=UPI001D51A9B1|nr:DUF4870 domain-containing protein [Microbacterium foliorum]CAH0132309.1 hypothetical protein SRABI03_00307 [Microbacterium foliorum]